MKTRNGWNVALLTSWPARASSTKPISEAIEVFFTTCTANPTVEGKRDAQAPGAG